MNRAILFEAYLFETRLHFATYGESVSFPKWQKWHSVNKCQQNCHGRKNVVLR